MSTPLFFVGSFHNFFPHMSHILIFPYRFIYSHAVLLCRNAGYKNPASGSPGSYSPSSGPTAHRRYIVYFLGTLLPFLIGSFHRNIIHSMKQKTITFFSRCNTFPDHFIKQIQKRIVLQPGLFDSIQKLPDTSWFSCGFRNPVILQLFVGLCL